MSTVRQALGAFLARHGIDRAGYASPLFVVRLGPVPLLFPNPGWLGLHDLHHVALDAPPTFWGEVEVSAFELRTGAPSVLIRALCVGALAFGALLAPRRVRRAWRRYAGATNLYRAKQGAAPADETGWYEALLDLDLADLRRALGVGRRDERGAREGDPS